MKANSPGQPQQIQYPQGQQMQHPQGQQMQYPQGQTVVVVKQTQIVEPPCCGITCIAINDFFWLWGPTGLSLVAAAEKGGLAVIYILGFIAHIFAIVAAVASCGGVTHTKNMILIVYKWFRLVYFILYLAGAVAVIIIGFILVGNTEDDPLASGIAKIIGVIIIILGVIIAIPGIIMASTHGCYTSDLAIKVRAEQTNTPDMAL